MKCNTCGVEVDAPKIAGAIVECSTCKTMYKLSASADGGVVANEISGERVLLIQIRNMLMFFVIIVVLGIVYGISLTL